MLKIYNSLTRTKEDFIPLVPGVVKLYVCGMTVYDFCHLGHGRVLVVFDMVVRWLQSIGYNVTYVRNITDIDDKIIKRAQEMNESIETLTNRFIKAMHEDAERDVGDGKALATDESDGHGLFLLTARDAVVQTAVAAAISIHHS